MLSKRDLADIRRSWLQEKMAELDELLFESAITFHLVKSKYFPIKPEGDEEMFGMSKPSVP
jgi:hypothetical protein